MRIVRDEDEIDRARQKFAMATEHLTPNTFDTIAMYGAAHPAADGKPEPRPIRRRKSPNDDGAADADRAFVVEDRAKIAAMHDPRGLGKSVRLLLWAARRFWWDLGQLPWRFAISERSL